MHNIKFRKRQCSSADDMEGAPKAKRGRPKVPLILTRYPPGALFTKNLIYWFVNTSLSVHVLISFLVINFSVRNLESDDVAYEKNSKELTKELQRSKPRKDAVLSLTRQTFPVRRACVLSNAEDVCVQSLLRDYPELMKPYVVSC